MTFSNTNALSLLGKQVSFVISSQYQLTDKTLTNYLTTYSGVVTDVVVSLSGEPQISVDKGDFYHISELSGFSVAF